MTQPVLHVSVFSEHGEARITAQEPPERRCEIQPMSPGCIGTSTFFSETLPGGFGFGLISDKYSTETVQSRQIRGIAPAWEQRPSNPSGIRSKNQGLEFI